MITRNRSSDVGWLFAILLLAAALRLALLPSQGLVHYDEGVHLMEARFLRTAILHDHLHRSIEVEGLPLVHGKPLHAAILAVAQSVVGDRPWTGGFAMALFSVGTVALTFALGRRFFGRQAGLFAALILATNPWSVLYGRLALPEADSTFLALLSIWIATGEGAPRKGRAFIVGLVASLAFQANYRWLVLLPTYYVGLELIELRRPESGSARSFALRLFLFALGFVLPLLLTDFLYGAWVLGPRLFEATRSRTYFEDLVWNIRKFSEQGWATGLRDPMRFPFFALRFGGPLMLAALGAGAWEAWQRLRAGGGRSEGRALWLSVAPPLLLLFSACGFPRCLSIALGPWAILGGLGLTRFARPGRSAALVVLVIVAQLAMAPAVYVLHSGYGDAAAWLKARGDSRCLASQAFVLRIERVDALGIPSNQEQLESLARDGYRYLVVDNQVWTGGQGAIYRQLRDRLPLVAELPHPAGGSATFSYESPERSLAATWERGRGTDWLRPSTIRIYDLAGLRAGALSTR